MLTTRNTTELANRHFGALSGKILHYKAKHEHVDNVDTSPLLLTLTQKVNIENGWLITDDNVEIFKNNTFKISSRFENGPRLSPNGGRVIYGGMDFSIGEGFPMGPESFAERGKVVARISNELFTGRFSIEIREDKLIYVDGIDKTPSHLRVDQNLRPLKITLDSSKGVSESVSIPQASLNQAVVATPEQRLLSECSPELVAYIKSFEGKKSFSARIEEMNPPLTKIERDQLVGIVNGKMIDRPIIENNNKKAVYDFSFALEVYENSVGFKPSRLSPSPETVANIEKSIQSIVEARKAKAQSVESPHVSSMTKILNLIPKLSLSSPQLAKKEEKVKSTTSLQQDKSDTNKWLTEMRAMVAGRSNVSDVCIGTESGNIYLSNTGTITGDDILRIQSQNQRRPG